MMFKRTRYRLLAGFTLLEMSIAMAIISVVAVMGLEAMAMYLSRTAYVATQERMATIDTALQKYRYVHGRLPCPAALPLAITDAGGTPATDLGYGKEDCTNARSSINAISSISVTAGQYKPGFPVSITSLGGGSGANIIFYTDGATAPAIIDGGSGYSQTDTINLGAGGTPKTPAVCTINSVDGAGVITALTCTSYGSGYQPIPYSFPVTIKGGGATTNAQATANVDATGNVTSIIVTAPGYGYTSAPTLAAPATLAATATTPIDGAVKMNTLFGGLPVRDLNLPLSYALDAYGSKFLYYVTQDLTSTATFANATGNIQVRSGVLAEPCDPNTSTCQITSPNAAYALLSVGRDKRGGYNQRGLRVNDCIPTTDYTSAIDAQNCIAEGTPTNAIGVTIPLGVIYNSTFSNGTPSATYFDDLVISHLKSEL